ncbi:MAG: L,D-transpeptidase family protein [Gammaproteobacteria bacterium]|nr:L,D-transpeptidase family protein [Gammaproteobacteria bacterium]MCP5459124.1 L,D-transpeptidase family protein [Gammaproteobacteria bacterium]
MNRRIAPFALLGLLLTFTLSVRAEVFVLPPPDVDVVGEIRVIYATHEDTLIDIARRYNIGFDELVKANPGVDRWLPGEGTPIVLPTRYILPPAPRDGIVLNVSEMRLYFYPKPAPGEKPVVMTFPVSVGRMDWKTPLGTTSVIAKQADPPWYPPASIKAEHAEQGDPLPDVVPPGPDNPLGRFALRLGKAGYLIHSTNKPDGVGMRVTHGCVRMFPENIEWLFNHVAVGTPVYIVDAPIKVGWLAGNLFLEAHAPLEEENVPIRVSVDDAIHAIQAKLGPDMSGVDPAAVELVVEQASGMPVAVSEMPGYTAQLSSGMVNVVPTGMRN